ncbi:hypothetical protein PM082_000674 [Marasmius tenuissimus]|nr:hypothetical protein PM082_000674 [Marasmius tenuissimus]
MVQMRYTLPMFNTSLLIVDLISYQAKALPSSLMELIQAHSHSRSYHHIITITIRESYPSHQHHSPHSSIDRSTPPLSSPLHEPTTPTATTATTDIPSVLFLLTPPLVIIIVFFRWRRQRNAIFNTK